MAPRPSQLSRGCFQPAGLARRLNNLPPTPLSLSRTSGQQLQGVQARPPPLPSFLLTHNSGGGILDNLFFFLKLWNQEPEGKLGLWVSNYPSPPASQGASHSPTQLQAVNSLLEPVEIYYWPLVSSPQRSFLQLRDGLNRNELTDRGFTTLSILASFFPLLSLSLNITFIFYFFIESQLGTAKIRQRGPNGLRSQTPEWDPLCSFCKLGHRQFYVTGAC